MPEAKDLEPLGYHPVPTTYLRWNNERLEQKWVGRDGEAWFPVDQVSEGKTAAEIAAKNTGIVPKEDGGDESDSRLGLG